MSWGKASIGFRLGAFAGFFQLALIGVGMAGWYSLNSTNTRLDDALRRTTLLLDSVYATNQAQVNFKIQVQDWKDILLRGRDQGDFKRYVSEFNNQVNVTRADLQKSAKAFESLNFDTDLVKKTLVTHDELTTKYQDAINHLDPTKPDSVYEVDRMVRGIDRVPTENMDGLSTYILQQSARTNAELIDQSHASYRSTTRWLLLTIFFSLMLGTVVTVRLIYSIRRRLFVAQNLIETLTDGTSKKLSVVKAISEGDYEQKIVPAPLPEIDINHMAADEIGVMVRATIAMGEMQSSLDTAFTKMSSSLLQNRNREYANDWLKSGQNELNTLMQGAQDTTILADKVLSYLVNRVGAGVGAFYLNDELSNQLHLASRYGLTEERNPVASMAGADRLIGQALNEKKIIQLDNVPPDYLPINGAWGSAVPSSVLIIPFLNAENRIGAMELGAFKLFNDLELEFLNKARESIAIGFDVNLSRLRTVALLEETKLQAEELRVQQEELQQTNEELEERAEMLEHQREQIRIKNTELEQVGEEIQRRSTELEVASAYKSEFLANMSHELRTPLNSMLILSGILKENKTQNLTVKQVEYAATINNAGKDLLNLISDILDLSKVESGQLEFNYRDTTTQKICDEMAALFNPAAENKQLTFKTELAEDAPKTIVVDQLRTQQVLKNLIGNALKFTESGVITLQVYIPSHAQNPLPIPSIGFAVSDTGIGVPLDKQSVIFDAFKQGDGGIARKYGGTGLGLSISRQLARKMGGDLQMSSEEGRGSTFTLYLPLEAEQTEQPILVDATQTTLPKMRNVSNGLHKYMGGQANFPVAIPDDRHNLNLNERNILIIEDDLNFAKILKDFVRERGYGAIVATDGESGIALAHYYLPNAILLDAMLPKVDGWEVMANLKDSPQTRHIPVHFITCLEDRKKAMEMGAIGFVTKPINQMQLDEIFQTIEEALSKSVKKLLIVEDDEGQAKSLLALLANRDIVISIAATGEEAIEFLSANQYDCMVLDLGLADVSGFELLEHIKQMELTKRIPVIIHSGRDLTREQERELHRYAESIIIKGAQSPERLLDEVTLFLHMVKSRSEPDKQTEKAAPRMIGPAAELDGKKVLLVDDDMRNIFSLSSLLEDVGLEVVEAENGVEALSKLADNPDIDIVLMDIMMPEMDGYETMRRIRKNPQHKALPIIAMTAKAMRGDQQKCIEAGANDYISKPIDTQKLMSLLHVWINQK